tara:strand:+ start:671 stop:1276 length:606 start_codon:yes stop_codon:yes gene_type:complete
MHRVAVQISRVIESLEGDWIVPKNAYEKALCNALSWEVHDDRYFDAFNGESYVEIKKGQSSMHFDMVRYAEILLGHGRANTITVFFRWNKKRKKIVEAYVIDTKRLIEFLHINKQFALLYLRVKARVPRGVNILASATAKDLRTISDFIVEESGGITVPPRQVDRNSRVRRERNWTQQSIQSFLRRKRKSTNRGSIKYYLF